MIEFSQEEILRYPRHFSVNAIGIEGQKKIKSARVLLVGAGGIGSPAATYLTAGGIGHLGIIDHDTIEISNLQRQILFRTADVGKRKVDIAKKELHQLNPFTDIQIYPEALSPKNATAIFSQYDYILDGSDNYPTRYLANKAAQQTQKILISASVFQFGGQVACFAPEGRPCYECLYPSAPPAELIPNCTQSGVLGVTPGILALLATNQILIHILQLASPHDFFGKVHEFNGLSLSITSYNIPANLDCPICSHQGPHLPEDQSDLLWKNQLNALNSQDFCKMTTSQNSTSTASHSRAGEISPGELKAALASKKIIQIIDVREPWEREISKIEPSVLIPLGQLSPAFSAEKFQLDPEKLTVTYCQAGFRSAKAAKILKDSGFKQVLNLSGGIDAWMFSSL
jgi:molybdopterin/thiamine biosynthesis adenylyltransferase/rhodanese-related sulfurtransferase